MKAPPRYTGVLSPAEALEGMDCCLHNAEELLDEAEMLIKAERYARAIALGLIAWEEMGKLPMLAGSPRYPTDEGEWKKRFWRRFRNHSEKLLMHQFVSPLEGDDSSDSSWLVWREFSAVRERMLYADFEGGSFRVPSPMPGIERVASRLIRALKEAFAFHSRLRSSVTPEKLEMIAKLTPAMFAAARRALEEKGVQTQDIPDLELFGALEEAGLDAKGIWEHLESSADHEQPLA